MKNLNNRKKQLISFKSIICTLSLLSGASTLTSCSNFNLDNYYIVRDSHRNYICTKHLISNEDEEYRTINNNETIGTICLKNGSFDYSLKNHSFNQKFLNELQIVPLKDALNDESIDLGMISNFNDLLSLTKTSSLNDIVNNHFVREKYYFHQNFVQISDSNLQLFVHDNQTFIGYDVSPDREFLRKNKYIYSISDEDVIEFNGLDSVTSYGITPYLNEDNKNNQYVTYNEAINILNQFNYYYIQKEANKTLTK